MGHSNGIGETAEMGKGKKVKLPNGRRLVDEVIRTSKKMPMATFIRDLDVSELAELRKRGRPKISWNVLYMKAFAILAEKNPVLRQCYVGFPWPYAYQHESNVCLLTLSRQYCGEERLLFARFNEPEKKSLLELQAAHNHYRKAPVKQIKQFRHQMRFARAPAWLRRIAWWVLFNAWPRKRMSHLGTFGMTLSGYKGAYATSLLGPNSYILGVDLLPKNGIAKFTITFDHQLMDGVPLINVIDDVYKTLMGEIADELREIVASKPATQAA